VRRCLGRVVRIRIDAEHTVSPRFARSAAGTLQLVERGSRRIGHRQGCETIEHSVERRLPRGVAPPRHSIQERQFVLVEEIDLVGSRQRARGQAMDDIRLDTNQRGHELQIVCHRVIARQSLQPVGPSLEHRLQIGQPDEGRLCDVADIDGIDDRPRYRHL
jgi:hypothetical protein